MELTVLYSNTANFRGNDTMNFEKYWRHYVSICERKYDNNLEEMVSIIRRNGVDIVGMGEVDECADWSGWINQPETIADKLHFDFAFCKNYYSPLPLLYSADTGNAVISKFPIIDKKVHNFNYRHIFEIFTSLVGRKKFMHTVHELPNNKKLHVVCTHLSVSYMGLRENAAKSLVKYFKTAILPLHESRGDSYILMGDFNTVPLYTVKKYGFKDNEFTGVLDDMDIFEKGWFLLTKFVAEHFPDDYREEKTLQIIGKSNLFKNTMTQNPFNPKEHDSGRYKTYPSNIRSEKEADDKRLIDYIFVSPDIRTSDVYTIKTGFSDHDAILTVLEIPD